MAKLLGQPVPPPTFVQPIYPSLPPTVSLPKVTVAKVPRVKEKRPPSQIPSRNKRLRLGQYLGAVRRFRSGTNYKHFVATHLLAQHILPNTQSIISITNMAKRRQWNHFYVEKIRFYGIGV